MHETAEIRLRRFQYEVDVVAHEAEQIEPHVEPPHAVCQRLEEPPAVGILLEDDTPVVAPRRDVVNRTFVFYA